VAVDRTGHPNAGSGPGPRAQGMCQTGEANTMREIHPPEIQHVSGGNAAAIVVAIGPIVASQTAQVKHAESKD